jgi:hypothetical protein
MKNIHVIPTTPNDETAKGVWIKETRDWCNIYITSDEKTAPSKGDWYLGHPLYTSIHRWHTDVSKIDGRDVWINKIILTTDQDLIGVQAIDDEFLEWFVKNPSCESVEVEIETTSIQLPQQQLSENSYDLAFRWINKKVYKIIIPKEEHKLETHGYICPQTKVQCDDECCVSVENCHIESLGEFAEEMFKLGAKWQEERSYSEEEVYKLLLKHQSDYRSAVRNSYPLTWSFDIKKWFDQFKKK